MHWEPTLFAASATNCGFSTADGVNADFIGARIEQAANIVNTAHPAADGKRNKYLGRNRFDNGQNQAALIRAGGDVEKSEFVSALAVVAPRNLNRIASIAQIKKIDAFDHAAGVNVQAGNNALG